MKIALIVDDSEVIRSVATGLFEKLGYESIAVDSTEAALEKLNENELEIIVADWDLPNQGALEVFKMVNVLGTGNPPICILTAMQDTQDIFEMAKEEGADYLMTKPYSYEDIKDLLELHAEAMEDRSLSA